MKTVRFLTLLIASVLLLVACGGGGEEPVAEATLAATAVPAEPTAAPAEPTAAPVEPTPEPAGVTSFRDAIQSTVQIEAQGSFMDPEFGMQLNSAGRGSGFIIDESGIAVTNNHVVTGAALLQVWVGGESDDPLNAKVIAVSECSDLAVIDIEGDGFTPLRWVDAMPNIGSEVYALGFPLGDPEPTITRGIISKEEAGGETSWASVDAVIEHDATINPGNSGGPLVNPQGEVVGVNYAGDSSANQYFAISAADAQVIINQLREGNNVDSIGINGEAVSDGQGLTGIWVASVESGSPADKAGIEAGDIVTKLEGLVLSTDGTMSDYCDILRSNDATDTLAVEVVRYATQEVLEGQINGTGLVPTFSFAQEVEEEVGNTEEGAVEGGEGAAETYSEYVGIYDDSNAIYVEVPAEWADVNGANWTSDEDGSVLGSALVAAPSIDGFNNTYTTPGVQIWASDGFGDSTMDELLDFFDFSSDCALDGRYDYEDPVYTGRYDLYTDCAGEGSVIIVLSAEPADKQHTVLVLLQALTDADLDAVDHVLDTFNIVGELPGGF
jgi:serine protease Do